MSSVIQPESSRAGVRTEVRHEDCQSQVLRLPTLPPRTCSRESPDPHSCQQVPPMPHLHAFRHLRHFRHRLDGAKLLECRQCRAGCCPQGLLTRAKRNECAPHFQPYHLKHFFCRDLEELHHSWSLFPGQQRPPGKTNDKET